LTQDINEQNNINYKNIEAKDKYLEKKINQKKIKNLEKELEKLKNQEKQLIDYFYQNPNNYDLAKVKELEEIKKNIKQQEGEWFQLNI